MDDAIELQIEIDATAERVWALVSEPGWWINDGDYRAHRIEPADDHDVVHDEHHGAFRIRTEATDPPRYVRFSWLTGDDEGGGRSPATTVEFHVTDRTGGGVVLRVVEAGFASLDGDEASRRRAWDENESGWHVELDAARRHVETP